MSTLRRVAGLSAACLIAAAALAGCSDEPEPTDPDTPAAGEQATTTPEPSAAPSETADPTTGPSPTAADPSPVAGGKTFTGNGYQVVVPAGWRTEPSMAGGPVDVVLIKEKAQTTDGISVVIAPTNGQDLDTVLPQAKKALEGHATGIADAPAITIDGKKAQGFSGTATQGKVPFVQYYVVQGDQLYEIDFSGPEGTKMVKPFTDAWSFKS
ncbi:hypothetical protein [Enemella sp. A6]|uniref:hypothetical protein n=1 Tax=Enemella sp. A6 TaxID=3440152 RepID=UPI003EBB7A7B